MAKSGIVFYVSGPYTGVDEADTDYNIREAEKVARKIWRSGFTALCPHTNSRNFDKEAPYLTFINGYLDLLERCDYVVALMGYQRSLGATAEIALAHRLGIPVIHEDDLDNFLQNLKRRAALGMVG